MGCEFESKERSAVNGMDDQNAGQTDAFGIPVF
ncbi:hypothetical protein SMB34_17795 [Thalassospira permensis NBRC 106175]|uniref:Uncharacterized protein n=1 Tax=Thalassospira permensis NBRC 106175 TaxID=1353532 RepID=A0ABR4TP11_9PROT|nr:hypothetical protein SMB34_17795 [Thalassospira permensis NBRC 106175]